MTMNKKQGTKRLGEILVENSLVTEEQLELALEDQKKNGGLIGEILVGWGYTTEESIVEALSKQYKFPYIQPTQYQVQDDVVRLIPKEIASRYSVVGLELIKSNLSVAMSNPTHQEAIEKIKEITECKINIFITTYTEILRSIERQYQIQKPGSI